MLDRARDKAYKAYMSDSAYYMMRGESLATRYTDAITRKVDTRSGDEIAADIIARAGLSFANPGEEVKEK